MSNKLMRALWILALGTGTAYADASEAIAINSVVELEQSIKASAGKPLLLRVSAEWSMSATEMDPNYASPCVMDIVEAAGIVVLEADITDDTADHRVILERFQIFGPPWAMLFDAEGNRIPDSDVVGYTSAYRLAVRIKDALGLDAVPDTCDPDDID